MTRRKFIHVRYTCILVCLKIIFNQVRVILTKIWRHTVHYGSRSVTWLVTWHLHSGIRRWMYFPDNPYLSIYIENIFHTLYFGHISPLFELLPDPSLFSPHPTLFFLSLFQNKNKKKLHKTKLKQTTKYQKTKRVQTKESEADVYKTKLWSCFVLACYSWARARPTVWLAYPATLH